MRLASNIVIGITAVLHFMFFKLESIDFMKPGTLAKFGLDSTNAIYAKPWAFNQGFYNLFFTLGLFYSMFLINKKKSQSGVVLANFILASIVGAGLVLYISTPEKYLAALIQAIPGLLGIVLLNLSNNIVKS